MRADDDAGTPVEVREIPAWEGERVRAFLRGADMKTAEEFSGACVCIASV